MIRDIAEFCFNNCQHIFYNKFVFWGVKPEEYLNKRNEVLNKINENSKIDFKLDYNFIDIDIRINDEERIDFYLTFEDAKELCNKFNFDL